jgi:uncharacterized protein (TIGR02284 family)
MWIAKFSKLLQEAIMENLETKRALETLNSLIHLDIDAVRAYTRAIDEIDFPEAKEELTKFRADHERHIKNLSHEMARLGGKPPENKPDLKGFFIETFTAIRSKMGTEQALKAMKSNEELTNREYENALAVELPHFAREIVLLNREDEARHLEYVSLVLNERRWEAAGVGRKVG